MSIVERGISRVVTRRLYFQATLSPKRSNSNSVRRQNRRTEKSPMAWRKPSRRRSPTGERSLNAIALDLVTEVQRSIDFIFLKGQTARSPKFSYAGQRESEIPRYALIE